MKEINFDGAPGVLSLAEEVLLLNHGDNYAKTLTKFFESNEAMFTLPNFNLVELAALAYSHSQVSAILKQNKISTLRVLHTVVADRQKPVIEANNIIRKIRDAANVKPENAVAALRLILNYCDDHLEQK